MSKFECQCEGKGQCEIFNRSVTGREVQVCKGIGANASAERSQEQQCQWASEANVDLDSLGLQFPKLQKPGEPTGCCPKKPSQITKGVGLLKAVFGRDKASDELIEQRLDQCYKCDQHRLGVCQACGCFVAPKAHVKSSACPADLW